MRALVAIALLVVPVPALAATSEDNVRAAVERLWKAWERGDLGAASAVYDETLLDTDFHGVRRRWPEVSAFLRSPSPEANVAITLSDFRIALHGSAAVASYLVSDCRTREGKRACLRFAASDFLVQRPAGWRIVGAHQSIVRDDAAAQPAVN